MPANVFSAQVFADDEVQDVLVEDNEAYVTETSEDDSVMSLLQEEDDSAVNFAEDNIENDAVDETVNEVDEEVTDDDVTSDDEALVTGDQSTDDSEESVKKNEVEEADQNVDVSDDVKEEEDTFKENEEKDSEEIEEETFDDEEEETPDEEEEYQKGALTFEKKDVVVTLNYDADAKIPSGAVLSVEEISSYNKAYNAYVEKTASEVLDKEVEDNTLPYARFFDITILSEDGDEIEPMSPVDVKIELKDKAFATEDVDFAAVHFTEEENKEIVPEIIPIGGGGNASQP